MAITRTCECQPDEDEHIELLAWLKAGANAMLAARYKAAWNHKKRPYTMTECNEATMLHTRVWLLLNEPSEARRFGISPALLNEAMTIFRGLTPCRTPEPAE